MKMTNKNIINELYERDIIDDEYYEKCQTNPHLCEQIIDAFMECYDAEIWDYKDDQESYETITDVKSKFLYARILFLDNIMSEYIREFNITGTFNDQAERDYDGINLYGRTIEHLINTVNKTIVKIAEDLYDDWSIESVPREMRKLVQGYINYSNLLLDCKYDCVALGDPISEDEEGEYKVSIIDNFIQEHGTPEFGNFTKKFMFGANQDNKKPTK